MSIFHYDVPVNSHVISPSDIKNQHLPDGPSGDVLVKWDDNVAVINSKGFDIAISYSTLISPEVLSIDSYYLMLFYCVRIPEALFRASHIDSFYHALPVL